MIANIFKTAIYHHSKKNFLKAKEIYETLLKQIQIILISYKIMLLCCRKLKNTKKQILYLKNA